MPKRVDHAARRRAIAEAAADLIAEHGLDAATSTRLARAAGYTVGALPHYFEGKEAILVASLRAVSASLERRGADNFARSGGDLAATLAAALPVDAAGRRDCRVWFAFSGRALHSPPLAAEYRRRYRSLERRAALLVDASRLAAGWTPRNAVQHLFAFLDGLGLHALIESRAWTARRQRLALRRQLVLLGLGDSPMVGRPT